MPSLEKYLWLFLRGILLTLLVLSPLFLYIGLSYQNEQSAPFDKNPYVYWNGLDPHHEVYISWETSEKTPSYIEYGIDPNNLIYKIGSDSLVNFHKVKLTGLSPNTLYYYRIADDSLPSNNVLHTGIRSFKTAPYSNDSGADSFNVTFISDTQQFMGTGHWNTIAKSIANFGDTDFLAIAGDVAQTEDDQANWNLFWKYADYLSGKMPIVTTPGNHDDPDNPQSLYFKYFGNTTNDYGCQYAFNWSDAQFVFMHIANWGDRVPNETADNMEAYTWLNKTLENGQQQKYRIIVFHRAVFSSLGNDEYLVKYIVPIVEKYNVSLVLYGHIHEYERFYYNGHNYVCLGGGGGMQDMIRKPQESTQVMAMGASFTRLFFNETGILLRTYSPTYDIMDDIFLRYENGNLVPERITTYGGVL